ncbi:MAG: UDP-N-acetylmuramoyl-tripeptide--D-alanyl-D-alanine ligase [Gammaproteobacteria bacterium]
MTPATLSAVANAVGGQLRGADRAFDGVSTDTRALRPAQLFVALTGPNFDGHDFVAAAVEAGAVGALVARELSTRVSQVIVADTRAALGALAGVRRASFKYPVVGITGSNGKTTVKEMTAAILRRRGAVLATRGNRNNDIGVPLTLLELNESHGAAVIEMGANHHGEIATLSRIARPTVGVVTNAGPSHLAGFGDIAGVASAKGELFASLPADGWAVINADDRYADVWRRMAAHCRRVEFGVDAAADFTADARSVRRNEAGGEVFTLKADAEKREVTLAVPGLHNVRNALAAAAAAVAAGATLDDVVAGLAEFQPVGGRLLAGPGRGGSRVIDDTYNANPASLRAALDVVAGFDGRRWLVLGDMGELGTDAIALHVQAGHDARAAGIDRLFALGPLAAAAAEAFGGGEQFSDADTLAAAVARELASGTTVLVKGSRTMRLERVVAALTADGG